MKKPDWALPWGNASGRAAERPDLVPPGAAGHRESGVGAGSTQRRSSRQPHEPASAGWQRFSRTRQAAAQQQVRRALLTSSSQLLIHRRPDAPQTAEAGHGLGGSSAQLQRLRRVSARRGHAVWGSGAGRPSPWQQLCGPAQITTAAGTSERRCPLPALHTWGICDKRCPPCAVRHAGAGAGAAAAVQPELAAGEFGHGASACRLAGAIVHAAVGGTDRRCRLASAAVVTAGEQGVGLALHSARCVVHKPSRQLPAGSLHAQRSGGAGVLQQRQAGWGGMYCLASEVQHSLRVPQRAAAPHRVQAAAQDEDAAPLQSAALRAQCHSRSAPPARTPAGMGCHTPARPCCTLRGGRG